MLFLEPWSLLSRPPRARSIQNKYPYKRHRRETQRRSLVEVEAERRGMQPKHRNVTTNRGWKRGKDSPPQSPWREHCPEDTLILDFWPPGL